MQKQTTLSKTLETMIPYYLEKKFGLQTAIKLAVADAVKILGVQERAIRTVAEIN